MKEPQLIETIPWLLEKADTLFDQNRDEARSYYTRALEATEDPTVLEHAHMRLAILNHRAGQQRQALLHLEAVLAAAPRKPKTLQALASLCNEYGDPRGLYWALFYLDQSEPDQAIQSLPLVARSLYIMNESEAALRVTLGALEQFPTHPHLLETLSRIYEAEGDWLAAIQTRDTLIDVLKSALSKYSTDNNPELQGTLDVEGAAARIKDATRHLQKGLHVVDLEVIEGEFGLSRLNHPQRLHTLITRLSAEPRATELLGMAQRLWAQSQEYDLDLHLGSLNLAAAIEWSTRKLFWMPHPEPKAWEVYGVEEDQIRAAVRLLQSSLKFEVLPASVYQRISRTQRHEMERWLLAYLLHVDSDSLASARMLI